MSECKASIDLTYSSQSDVNQVRRRVDESRRRSAEYWVKASQDERVALAVVVQDVLSQLIVDPLSWLPSCAKPAGGGRLELSIGISLEEVDHVTVEMRALAEQQMAELRQGLIEMREGLA